MILVDEAVQQFADSVGRYGANPKRNRQPGDIGVLLDEVDRLLPGDLRIPREMRDFWCDWNPSTFGMIFGEGLPTLERTLVEWETSTLPNILLLVCSQGEQSIYVEIESDAHPGTRLYMCDRENQTMHLWGIGMVGLLDLVASAYRSTGADPHGPYHRWVDWRIVCALAEESAAQIVATPSERRVDLVKSESWPSHWQLANELATGSH